MTQRYQNHWYPGQPSKGQAYRCIRINQNCRVDSSIEMACQHAGISYEALRLPVELTLWIDPSEVACRIGEHKGSYFTVAKLGDGRQENFADSINIDELEQRSIDRSKQSFENPRLKMKPTHGSSQVRLGAGHHVTSSAKQSRNQTSQSAAGLINPFASTTTSNSSLTNSNVSYHAMNGNSIPNGGITSQQNNHHLSSHGSPVGNTLTNGYGLDYAAIGAATNGIPPSAVFGPVGTGSTGSGTGGLPFHQAPNAAGSSGTSQPFQYPTYFNAFHPQAAANFQQQQQQAAVAAAAVAMHPSWSPGSHLFDTTATSKFMSGLTGSPQQNPTSSTPPTSVAQLQAGGQSGRNSLCPNHLPSTLSASPAGFRSGQVNSSLTSAPVSTSSATSQVSTSKSNSQLSGSSNVLTNGTLTSNSGSSPNNSSNSNTGGANPNAPLFIPRHSYMLSHLNHGAQPFTPSSLSNSFQSLDQSSTNGSNSTTVSSISKDRRSFVNPNHSATSSSVSPSAAASTGATAAATATPLVANNRY